MVQLILVIEKVLENKKWLKKLRCFYSKNWLLQYVLLEEVYFILLMTLFLSIFSNEHQTKTEYSYIL